MAISFPGPEAVSRQQAERSSAGSLIVKFGRVLRRCYERACSAIFDADGDCMRL